MGQALLLALLVNTPAAVPTASGAENRVTPLAADEELWVGHQVVLGQRSFMVLGTLDTKTESFFLARVRRVGDALHFSQWACRVEFRETMGVKIRMTPETLARVPLTRFTFKPSPHGDLWGGPWTSGWNEGDVDGDGEPGATIHVDASLCGGDIYVASTATSRGVARPTKDGLAGSIEVRVAQTILGASGTCLSMASSDSEQDERGWFAYAPAAAGTTCESLRGKPWPINAGAER